MGRTHKGYPESAHYGQMTQKIIQTKVLTRASLIPCKIHVSLRETSYLFLGTNLTYIYKFRSLSITYSQSSNQASNQSFNHAYKKAYSQPYNQAFNQAWSQTYNHASNQAN